MATSPTSKMRRVAQPSFQWVPPKHEKMKVENTTEAIFAFVANADGG
jgi:hypothetical protein